jgi:hypothetical protein
MKYLDKHGLGTLLAQFKLIFGSKATLDECAATRNEYLLNIDYEKDLAFNTSRIVLDNSPYVGSAMVGSTYLA